MSPPVAVTLGRVLGAPVAVVPLVLLEEGQGGAAGGAREIGHGAWSLGERDKGFSVVSGFESIRPWCAGIGRQILLQMATMVRPRHPSSVGRAAAL